MFDVEKFRVQRSTTIRDALHKMEKSSLGLLLLIDEGRLIRTITDGDLRRTLLESDDLNCTIGSLPEKLPAVLTKSATRRDVLNLMNKKSINHVPIVDESGALIDVVDRKTIDDQILLSTPHIGSAERDFVEEAFASNWIAPLGPNVDAFERELSAEVGIAGAAAVSSGTAAIHLALRLLGVGPGDKVFCSSLTFAASANPIIYQGAEPVFIDSDRVSWNMAPEALERAFEVARSEGWLPKAVIVVCLYGQSADMDRILEICDTYGVPVVEDAAESLGAQYKGKPSGTFGRLGIYSFNGNKIITTSGGGMLVSDEEGLIERARFLATQARDPAPHYQHSEVGYNYRMSNILAGVGRGQLSVLGQRVDARRKVFELYQEYLDGVDAIEWMPEPDWSYSTRWLSACTIVPRVAAHLSKVIANLSDDLIEARPVWKPMHLQPIFSHCRFFSHANQPVSTDLFQRGLCLPSGSNLTEEQVKRTARSLARAIDAAT